MNQAPPVIEVSKLSKSFAGTVAVSDTSLSCRAGELIAILGASGCGKSTLLKLICGLEQPDCGKVFIQGQDATALPPEQRPVNMVFQSYALFPHLSALDNIAYGLKIAGNSAQDIRRRCGVIIELTRLSGLERRLPAQLSGGQQQRVALARALVMQPAALLLDEPLAALDAKLREQMRGYLGELQATLGITFLLVTHDQEEALALSSQLAFMHEGAILQCAEPETVYRSPANYTVASFLGKMAFLPARIDMHGNLSSPALGRTVALGRSYPAGAATLGIRPEHITLAGANGGQQPGTPVEIERVEFHGQAKLVTAMGYQQARLAAWLPADQPLPQGSLMASWEDADMLVFDAAGKRLAWRN